MGEGFEPGAVMLALNFCFCAGHMQQLCEWGSYARGVTGLVTMMDLAARDERIIARDGGKLSFLLQDAVVKGTKPCCFLGDEVMAEVYAAAEAVEPPPGEVKLQPEDCQRILTEYVLRYSPSGPMGLFSAVAENIGGNPDPLGHYVERWWGVSGMPETPSCGPGAPGASETPPPPPEESEEG